MSAYKQAALMRCNYSSHIPRLAISKRSGEPVHVVYFANPMGFRMVRKTKLQVRTIHWENVAKVSRISAGMVAGGLSVALISGRSANNLSPG